MTRIDPVEAMARAVALALFPILEAAMAAGLTYRQAMAAAREDHAKGWQAQHGWPVAQRAWAIFETIGPAHILTQYGRDVFLEQYPLGAIPIQVPVARNDNPAPPREAIGGRFRQAWRSFWGVGSKPSA